MCARLRQGHFLSQMASADPGRCHAGRAVEKRTACRDISEDVVGRTGGDGQGPLDFPVRGEKLMTARCRRRSPRLSARCSRLLIREAGLPPGERVRASCSAVGRGHRGDERKLTHALSSSSSAASLQDAGPAGESQRCPRRLQGFGGKCI